MIKTSTTTSLCISITGTLLIHENKARDIDLHLIVYDSVYNDIIDFDDHFILQWGWHDEDLDHEELDCNDVEMKPDSTHQRTLLICTFTSKPSGNKLKIEMVIKRPNVYFSAD